MEEVMNGRPFHRGLVINLAQGEKQREAQLPNVPKNALFIIEFVSINSFLQQSQQLFFSLGVTTDTVTGIYPIVPAGSMASTDPAFAVRRFGSQRVLLYADANTAITITFARDNDKGAAEAIVEISGRLVTLAGL
jgi:hypothetical protein